jgi:hypothetical protein
MRVWTICSVSSVIAGMVACAGNSQYVYTPDAANATEAGLPAARTAIPPEQPQGAIEVTSYGVTSLQQSGQRDGSKIPALHVRAVVTNDGDDTPWTLDTSQQMVAIPGEGQSRAMFVNSDIGTLPNVTIAKHERRVLDFYFPLPDTAANASRLPRFDLLWQVTTPARTVASRTSFDRVDSQPNVAYEVAPTAWPLWAGYGPYWWYDPFYPRAVFLHSRPYVVRGTGRITVGGFGGRFRAGGGGHVATGRRR